MGLRRRSSPSKVAPIIVPPSQDWDGNDGPWSSFSLQIGTPAQNVKVMVSTSGYQTWAIAPEGCTPTDPSNCAVSRGGEFDPTRSSSWAKNNVTANGTFTLDLEENLGYSGNGKFGYDSVTLGWQGSGGPSLDQQIVAGIATKEFYLGLFGVNPQPTNFTDFNRPIPSYMENLHQKSLIPSLSWGYTAGNRYRLNQVLGSLTLGGYDASRFMPNPVNFAFNKRDIRYLTVNIEKIGMTTQDGDTILSKKSIAALVDSTIPYLYLPLEVCRNFEDAFGITWNDTVQAYLVNDTLHSQLEIQNATVTFSLGNTSSTGSVDISLPYAAFDLTAGYPLLTNESRYFPLMRADNESQYTLGRTFLQEAYLTTDYERQNFSVSQCKWEAEAQEDIVAITSPAHEKSVSHVLPGQIVGIAVGGIILLIVMSLAVVFVRTKVRIMFAIGSPKYELDASKAEILEIDNRAQDQHEIHGSEIHAIEMNGNCEFDVESNEVAQHELHGNDLIRHEMPGKSQRVELQA